MKVWKFCPGEGFEPCVFPENGYNGLLDLFDDIKCMEPGDQATLDCLEMTQEEFDLLPEHGGY